MTVYGSWGAALGEPPAEGNSSRDSSAVSALEGDVVIERLSYEVGY